MNIFLNDVSFSPKGVQIEDNWNVIYSVISICNYLTKYRIERIKIQSNFVNSVISGSHSLRYYLDLPNGDFRKGIALNFFTNRIDTDLQLIDNAIEEEFNNKGALVDVYLNNQSSKLLVGAYLMSTPTISFNTHTQFEVKKISARLIHYYKNDTTSAKTIELDNIYTLANINEYNSLLIEIEKSIFFGKNEWRPLENPIWNTQKNSELIKAMKFPLSTSGSKDKKSELKEVGTFIALLNGWIYDERVTKLNKSRDKIRLIFKSVNCNQPAYISIDLEKAYGCFELHDNKGRHEREISFLDGRKTGNQDDTHSIRVR